MGRKYDFSGWATRNNIRCADGLTIRKDAFKDCDGMTVPIVWSHIHDDPEMVLGHAVLWNHPDGVRIDGKFNNTPKGRQTKELVESGDVVGLSIWANQLKKSGNDVLHGTIREVSVVLAGANPGAYIDTVMLAHSADGVIDDDDFDAVITTGEPIELMHSAKKRPKPEPEEDDEDEEEEEYEGEDEEEEEYEEEDEDDGDGGDEVAHSADEEDDEEINEDETIGDVFDTLNKKQKTAVYAILGQALENAEEISHSAEGENEMATYDEDMTVGEVFDTLDEDQKTAVYAILGQALEDNDMDEDDDDMKHNVFDADDYYGGEYISHADIQAMTADIMSDAKRLGSLREALEHGVEEGNFLAHAVYNHDGVNGAEGTEQTYGIADINYLFPEARTLNNVPEFIKRNDEWVNIVINGTHHTPFSRIKSVFANITNEEARARGYVKGNEKSDEVFSLLKRSTDPQTIYKRQKMDRDDIIDITDFDVVAWLRGEMRIMLNEEIARAILIGDGRLSSDDDKIHEDHVRPIVTDAPLYNITAQVTVGQTMEITAKNLIRAAIRARKDYKGSGSPTLFTGEAMLTEMMLLEDGLGHPLYADEAALARRMRVSRIVTCPLLDTATVNGNALYGIIVNLSDYNIGADKGGEINMFDDFDIDFNQQKYLIETRISGALIRPYSAITLVAAASNSGTDGASNG